MTNDEIRSTVLRHLCNIAPEADPAELKSNISFRDQLDIDSMDFLNYVIALHEALGVDIPESDYASIASIDGAVAYLSTKLKATAKTS